jgi:hypothetical protein
VRRDHTEGMNSRVHPKYKTKYRVMNWAPYSEGKLCHWGYVCGILAGSDSCPVARCREDGSDNLTLEAGCPSPKLIRAKSLTSPRLPVILQTMRAAIPRIAAVGTALSARSDLLLEILALRHQLAVLGHSDRRFRPADRLLWLCLRRWWPRWKEAVVLVQPATVARWHREGLRRC